MTARPTRTLHIDGVAHEVPTAVWAHFRFLSAQLSSMATHATKQAGRIALLEAERPALPLATIIAAQLKVRPKGAEIVELLFLARGEFVPSRTLQDALKMTKDSLGVQAHHLRKAGIGIEGLQTRGYRLTPEAMEKCRAVCGDVSEMAVEPVEVTA